MSGKHTGRLLLGLIIFLGCGILAEAAWLRNVPVKVKQPDGTVLDCLASGDEFYNWLHDKDGYTIVRSSTTGFLVYADKVDGKLVPTVFIAGRTDPQTLELAGIRKKLRDEKTPQKNRISAAREELVSNTPQTGTINNLVVYIRFSDEAEFSEAFITDSKAAFNTSTAGANSFRNYFSEVSYGQLTISSTFYPNSTPGLFSYQDSHPRAYYQPYDATTNPQGYNGESERTTREQTLLRDAVNAISAEVPAGLNIDADPGGGDGQVDNICFIVTGSPTAWSTLLWPHKWSLFSYYVYINGKRVYTYNFQLQDAFTVGALCHEMFHSLGAPDLYHDQNGSYANLEPVWAWDLMEWNLDPPEHMGAYMKYKYGKWIASIPEITTSGTYVLSPLTSALNNCYEIRSPFSPTEFFVVEYRKQLGTFEGNLYNQGLLVYRINSAYTGNFNGPPDEVYIYRPDGTLTEDGEPWFAPFSHDQIRTQINDSTNPSSFLTAGTAGGLQISNVGVMGSTISFDVAIDTITVTSPNGGETWTAGGQANVTWTSTGTISSVDILLSTDGGSTWTRLADDTANDGAETITVPSVSSSSCLIAVAEGTSGFVYDQSDASFSIAMVTNSITVTAPNGGESWKVGSSHNITWTQTGLGGSVTIDLYKGGVFKKPLGTAAATAGSFGWTISTGETPGTDYRVRISQGSTSDESDANFAISPFIRVDFNRDGQEDILWRYYGSGVPQGWDLVWLMNQSGTLLPAAVGVNQTKIEGMMTGSAPKRTYVTPLNVGNSRAALPAQSSKTPMGVGKVLTPRPKRIAKHPFEFIPNLGRGDKVQTREKDLKGMTTLKDPAETSARDSVLVNVASLAPSALSSGTTKIASLNSSAMAFLPTVLDMDWELVGTGDFNGDRNTDTLWRCNGSGYYQGWNVIWYMNGETITSYGFLPTVWDTNWKVAGTGDFNGDGKLEILWRYYGSGDLQGWNVIWYMNGTTIASYGFPPAVTDLNWKIDGIGDFNGDGKAEIFWRYYGTGYGGYYQGWNVIWFMNGTTIASYGFPTAVTKLGWRVDGVGDFDGDGKADLLWRYYDSGYHQGLNVVWYMDGAAVKSQEYLTVVYDTNWRIVNR
jgi:M6 family metalloprotease-like protein